MTEKMPVSRYDAAMAGAAEQRQLRRKARQAGREAERALNGRPVREILNEEIPAANEIDVVSLPGRKYTPGQKPTARRHTPRGAAPANPRCSIPGGPCGYRTTSWGMMR